MSVKNKGFSLIEIIVVVTMISMLTAVVTVSYTQYIRDSRDSRRELDAEEIRLALERYKSDDINSQYPPVADGAGLYIRLRTDGYLPENEPADPQTNTDYPLFYRPLPGVCVDEGDSCTSYSFSIDLESGATLYVTPLNIDTLGVNTPTPTPF